MEPSKLYPIEEYFMTKNRCYRANKRRKPTGIQVHSVGCKGTNRDRWRRWNTSSIEKCANAIIDTNGIMQTLDWDVRPWLSGKGKNGNANDTYVGFEICEPATKNDTAYAAEYLYNCVVYLCTELCKEYGIAPENIKCHSELHSMGMASNHSDVTHWWGKKGTAWEHYTMYTLRDDVAKNLGKKIPYDTNVTLKNGNAGTNVYKLQELLNALGYDCGSPDGLFGKKTLEAVKSLQKDHHLFVDGIVGKQTWGVLLASTVDEYAEENSEQEAVNDARYTVIIKHLEKSEADAIVAQYENAFSEEET